MRKWIWSLLLVCVMLFGLPQTVRAEEEPIGLTDTLLNAAPYINETGKGYTLTEGSYKLTGDITLTNGSLFIGGDDDMVTVTLDLNGYVLQLDSGYTAPADGYYGSVIRVGNAGSTLIIKDSDPNAKHYFNTSDSTGLWTFDESATASGENVTTVTGGVITGGKGTQIKVNPDAGVGAEDEVKVGGGIYAKGTVTMNGGSIVGCTADRGGGVYYGDKDQYESKTFTMDGSENSVTIQGCKAERGGGVYAMGKVSFTMSGSAKVADCKAERGGGVYCGYTDKDMSNAPTFVMKGSAQIANCTATEDGGGVYAKNGGSFTMNGTATVTACKATGNGGGLCMDTENASKNTAFTMEDEAAITGCKAANGGGAYINASYKGSFTMKGESALSGCVTTGGYDLVLKGEQAEMEPTGGTVSGKVLVGSKAKITKNSLTCSDTTFQGEVTNNGTITGGIFNEKVTNYGTVTGDGTTAAPYNFVDGTISGGVFNEAVVNGCITTDTTAATTDTYYYYGIIQGGTFYGEVTNTNIGNSELFSYVIEDNGSLIPKKAGQESGVIKAGTFKEAVTNSGSIEAGRTGYSGSITSATFEGTVTNKSGGSITAGTFTGTVTNASGGKIAAGTVTVEDTPEDTSATFKGTVTNSGSITAGTFTESSTVTNSGSITTGSVTVGERTNVTSATFSGKVTNASGGSIGGGTFSESSTVTNNSTISGGTFTGTLTNASGGNIAGTLVKVTFALNDGSEKTHATQYYGKDAIVTAPTAPKRTGYEFEGWYKEANGTTEWKFDTDTVTAELTLHAKWTAKTGYSVAFASGVAEGETPAAENMPGNKSGTLKWTDTVLSGSEAPTRTGYAFTGWKVEKGTAVSENTVKAGTAYTYADLAGTDDSTTTLTLTAQWKQSTQPTGTITFKKDGTTFGTWSAFTTPNAGTPSVWVKPGTYTVEITGTADEGETVTIRWYQYITTADIGDEEDIAPSVDTIWSVYSEDADKIELKEDNPIPSEERNRTKNVICARLKGSTGLVTYLCTGGIVVDGTPPVITGVTDGATYCGAVTVKVTDASLDPNGVTVDEAPVTLSADGSFTLSPKTGAQTIVATDKAGNETSVTVTVNNGHTYEWKSESGEYWQKCKYCGDETDKSAIPQLTINGAGKVCRTQNAVLTFTLPTDVTLSTCRYGFGALAMQTITPVRNTDGSYILTVSTGDYPEGEHDLRVTLEAKLQGDIPLTAEKSVTLQDAHSGGEATCKAAAVCEVCGVPYGEVNTSKHTGTESWEKTADTHRKYWDCCGADSVKTEAHEWSADGVCTECGYVCQHSGGEATCKSGAVCEHCGASYGAVNTSKHTGTEGWEKTADTHRKYWDCCGADSVAAEAHEWSDGVCTECGYVCQHSGGEATCTAKAVCAHCGASYGAVNASKHTGTAIWEKTADTHKRYWSCCGAVTVETEAHEWSDGVCMECGYVCQHSGGEATCTGGAVCVHCGASYGERNAAKHAHGLTKRDAVRATATAEGNTAYWYCADCGRYFADADGRTEITRESTVLPRLSIIEGAGQGITAGANAALAFRSNAPFADFIRVELDGSIVAPENYDATEGSTIITLHADFVAALPAGEHILGIVSEGGTATVSFAVAAAPASGQESAPAATPTPEITTITPPVVQEPSTGDSNIFAGLLALVFLSGGAYVLLLVLRRSRTKEEEK